MTSVTLDYMANQTASITLLRRQIIETFEGMLLSLDELAEALTIDNELMAWVAENNALFCPTKDLSIRDKIIQVLRQYEYLPTQAPREIIICAGFIGASENTLDIVNKLNFQKESFKQAILAIKKIKNTGQENELTFIFEQLLLHKRNIPTADNLRKIGLARLHLKQCYRKIPVLLAPPLKISWTWANTRSIKKISVAEAEKMLKKRDTSDEGIQLQLKKLATLPKNESLAIVQNLAPHLRANLVMGTSQPKERLMIKGPIPIFFPATKNLPWPKFSPPKKKTKKNDTRVIRNDVRLDPLPFLPAIRAHRYLKLS